MIGMMQHGTNQHRSAEPHGGIVMVVVFPHVNRRRCVVARRCGIMVYDDGTDRHVVSLAIDHGVAMVMSALLARCCVITLRKSMR